MNTLCIAGAPLVKTDDQRRAEARARRAALTAYLDVAVFVARGTFWALAVLTLVGLDRVAAGAAILAR